MLQIILYALAFIFFVGLVWLILPYRTWKSVRQSQSKEQITIITSDNKRYSLSEYKKIQKDSYLSLVVPSYNEEARLPIMLQQTAEYLKDHRYTYQIIIANDGSKDNTTNVAIQTSKKLKINTIVIQYPKNRGKGGAVRAGVQVASGKYILMVDADGATKFSDFSKLEARIKELQSQKQEGALTFVVGSRRTQEEQGKVQRKLHRRIVSFVFKTIITILLGIRTKDTQCGFKLFNKETAKLLFKIMHINRFAFDVQLFFLSNQLKVQTAEVGVEWHDVDGSKLTVLDASINMLRDVLVIRLYYLLNLWKISDRYEIQ